MNESNQPPKMISGRLTAFPNLRQQLLAWIDFRSYPLFPICRWVFASPKDTCNFHAGRAGGISSDIFSLRYMDGLGKNHGSLRDRALKPWDFEGSSLGDPPQFFQSPNFNLTHSLLCDPKSAAHLLQGLRLLAFA